MARVLIVGYGNPARSDDGLGWHVAQQLSRERAGVSVEVIAAQQLTPEMAEAASHVELMLFVDAARNGKPGSLRCEEIVPGTASGGHSHELTPSVILTLAKELYGRCPQAYLLTVTGENFETGETMSAAVNVAIPGLMARIRELIDGAERLEK